MPLSITEADLTAKRWSTFNKIFASITPRGRVQSFLRPTPQGVIAGLGTDRFGSNPRRARHSSRVPGIFINYFEVWIAQPNAKTFSLERAYFHLDAPLANGVGDDEILALHCDALIPKNTPSFTYKRGLHFHFPGAKRNLGKAHIALCLSDMERTCSEFDRYSSAFAAIIKMIDEEILSRLP
jgi:hypothetical protein